MMSRNLEPNGKKDLAFFFIGRESRRSQYYEWFGRKKSLLLIRKTLFREQPFLQTQLREETSLTF